MGRALRVMERARKTGTHMISLITFSYFEMVGLLFGEALAAVYYGVWDLLFLYYDGNSKDGEHRHR